MAKVFDETQKKRANIAKTIFLSFASFMLESLLSYTMLKVCGSVDWAGSSGVGRVKGGGEL